MTGEGHGPVVQQRSALHADCLKLVGEGGRLILPSGHDFKPSISVAATGAKGMVQPGYIWLYPVPCPLGLESPSSCNPSPLYSRWTCNTYVECLESGRRPVKSDSKQSRAQKVPPPTYYSMLMVTFPARTAQSATSCNTQRTRG